jgi:peptide/nickel transport system substrate-binding protein
MRTYYWYFTAYLRKHGPTLLLSVLFAVVFFSFTIPFIVRRLGGKATTYVGLVGDYTLNSLPPLIEQQLSLGLTKTTDDGSVEPELAERWTVEDEGKTYRFVLRKDLHWHGGAELKPADVNYQFQDVEVVTTPQDVIFKLPDAYAPFPSIVSQPLFKRTTQTYGLFFKRPFIEGLGDYRLVDYKLNGQRLTEMTLENRQHRLVYRFFLTENDAVIGFKHGIVDVLPELTNPVDMENWPNVEQTATLHEDRYLGIFFNTTDPVLTKNIRQALAYALHKPTGEERAISPINPNSWAYFQGGKSYDYDMAKALERALTELPSQPLNLELTTVASFQDQAEDIKRDWEAFGQAAVTACQSNSQITEKEKCPNLATTVTIRVTPAPDTNSYQVLLMGQVIPNDPDQYFWWHSDQTTNFTRYKNTRIDSLLEKGRQTLDQEQRKTTYQEFQQFFLEDVPVIYLNFLDTFQVRRI